MIYQYYDTSIYDILIYMHTCCLKHITLWVRGKQMMEWNMYCVSFYFVRIYPPMFVLGRLFLST